MAKVIETNISYGYGAFDHQSRVIEVDSWESYVNEINNRESVDRYSCIGCLHGLTLPRNAKDITIEDFKCDDFHLSFYIRELDITKLAYLAEE